MNTQFLKTLGLFISSYLAVLLYPVSYLFSPLYSPTLHKYFLITIIALTTPVYIIGIRKFGFSTIQQTVKFSFRKGRVLQRVIAGVLIFFVIGLINAIIISALTTLNTIPFAIWSPIIEGIVLVICLFALLLQVAIIQSYRNRMPSEDEIAETFERAEQALKNQETESQQSETDSDW